MRDDLFLLSYAFGLVRFVLVCWIGCSAEGYVAGGMLMIMIGNGGQRNRCLSFISNLTHILIICLIYRHFNSQINNHHLLISLMVMFNQHYSELWWQVFITFITFILSKKGISFCHQKNHHLFQHASTFYAQYLHMRSCHGPPSF